MISPHFPLSSFLIRSVRRLPVPTVNVGASHYLTRRRRGKTCKNIFRENTKRPPHSPDAFIYKGFSVGNPFRGSPPLYPFLHRHPERFVGNGEIFTKTILSHSWTVPAVLRGNLWVRSRLGLGYLFKQEVTLSNPLHIGIPKDWVTW